MRDVDMAPSMMYNVPILDQEEVVPMSSSPEESVRRHRLVS